MTTQAALASLDDLKQFIEVRADEDRFDEKLLILARTATRQIEQVTRSEFIKQQRTEIFDAHYHVRPSGVVPNVIRLKARPVDFGLSFAVHHDPNRAFGSDTLLTLDTDYYYDSGKERLMITAALSEARSAIRCTYTGGYETTDPGAGGSEEDLGTLDINMSASAPEALRMACMVQAGFLWTRIQSQNFGTREIDGTEIATGFNLTPEASALAMPFSNLVM